MVQAFIHPKGREGLSQRRGSQSNSQSILCVSLNFSIPAVYSLAQGNLNGSYICFLSIPEIIPQCCNRTGFLYFLYSE